MSKIRIEDEALWDSDKKPDGGYPSILEDGENARDIRSILLRFLDTLPFYAMLIDEKHRIILANQAISKDLQQEPEEVMGKYCPEVIHGLDHPYPGCPLEESVEKGTAIEKEFEDPQTGRWVSSAVYPSDFRTEDGREIYSHMVYDITDKKQALGELQRSQQIQDAVNSLLVLALQNVPLEKMLAEALDLILAIPGIALEKKGCIFLLEEESQILVLKAQRGLSDYLKAVCAQLPLGRCLCGLAASTQETQFASEIDDRHEIMYEGISPHGHYCVPILHDGKTLGVINLYLKVGHKRNPREEIFLTAMASALAIIINHEKMEQEKEDLHKQLLQAQKMEAVGQMAGGIVHDFNNVLTAIMGACGFLMQSVIKDDPRYEDIKVIEESGQRAAALTRQLLAFSRKQIFHARVVSLNPLIENLGKMLRRLVGEHIELLLHLAPDLGNVRVDPGQLEQVVVNLAVNARDAMREGGTLKIETENFEVGSHGNPLPTAMNSDQYTVLRVRDTGCGMDTETLSHIFEPFFTTKATEGGTGLGLATAFGIIKQSEGIIEVDSEPGEGTEFRIYLPRVDDTAENEEKEIQAKRQIVRDATILLVEDSELVRKQIRRQLVSEGFKVLDACHGKEALKMTWRHSGRIDLLLTDVVMPHMNGRELAEELVKKHPEMKIIFMSGFADGEILDTQDIPGAPITFIPKPFDWDTLLVKVREGLQT